MSTEVSETKDGAPAIHAATTREWRDWLARNGESAGEVWLIMYHRDAGTPTISHDEAVQHALCYGWIDSKSTKRDEHSRYQRFSPRNPRSNWSKINKDHVERLTAAGLMTERGQAMVDEAKRRGTWDALADADNLLVPDDLRALFDQHPVAWQNFQAFPPSSKRLILAWIITAKRPETRQKRITETVTLAAENKRANH